MKKIIVIVFFLNTCFGFSQNGINDYISLRDQLKTYDKNGQISDRKIEGTPYLSEEFIKGVIIQEGTKYQNAFFRYNAVQDIVEIKVKQEQSEIFILPRLEKFVFKMTDRSYFIKNLITNEGEVLSGYHLNYYESDKILFIGDPKSKITTAKKADTSYESDKPSKILINLDYYISFNGNPLIEVKLKERYFKKILDDSPRLSRYFKENKIKEIEDVVKLLEFYNSII